MVDPLDDLYFKMPSYSDSHDLEIEVKRVRDGSTLAFKVQFAISQSMQIGRELT